MKQYSHCLTLILALLAISYPTMAAESPRKTVCSATLNSSNEIELFKKYLSPLGYEFIELTDDTYGGSDWFNNGCKKKVQCDILVISGHFGGNFFGPNGTLNLDKLETKACENSCDGIIKRPKEVFLFGCNTLAGKNPDHRTPESYYQVLLDDRIPPLAAQVITGYRYGNIGQSFNERMTQVFSHSPRIYGFHSIAPMGERIEPFLEDYLKSSQEFYRTLSTHTAKNELLFKKLNPFALAQVQGNPNSIGPVCQIERKELDMLGQLKWIKAELDAGRLFKSIDGIAHIVNRLKSEMTVMSREEIQQWYEIQDHKLGRQQILDYIKTPTFYMSMVQVSIFQFADFFNWVTGPEKEAFLKNYIWGDLEKDGFSEDRLELIEQIESQFDLPTKVPASLYEDVKFLEALEIAKPRNKSAFTNLVKQLNHQNPGVRRGAILSIGGIGTASNDILRKISISLEDSDEYVRNAAARALAKNPTRDTEIIKALYKSLQDPESSVSSFSAKALIANIGSKDLLIYFAKGLEDPKMKDVSYETLQEMNIHNDELLPIFEKYLQSNDRDLISMVENLLAFIPQRSAAFEKLYKEFNDRRNADF